MRSAGGTPPLVGLRSTSSPTASTSPVNISLNQDVRPERLDPPLEQIAPTQNEPAGEKRHSARCRARAASRRAARNRPAPSSHAARVHRGAAFEQQRSDLPRAPGGSAPREACRRAATSICAPRASSGAGTSARAAAAAVVTMMTGPASRVESTRASGGVRSRRSKTTRVSGRSRKAPRAVSCGSSASMVPTPTPMASTSRAKRVRVTVGRGRSQHRSGAPGACGDAAVEADRRLEHDERPLLANQREERLIERVARLGAEPDVDASRRARAETRSRGRAPADSDPRRRRRPARRRRRRCARRTARCGRRGSTARACSRASRRARARRPRPARALRRAARRPARESPGRRRRRRPTRRPRRPAGSGWSGRAPRAAWNSARSM